MRKIENPPYIQEKWEFGNLMDDLMAIQKHLEVSEVNDSSYPYWEKWKYLAKDWNFDARKLWKIIKLRRSISQKKINFNSKGKFDLYINTPSIMQQKLHELDVDSGPWYPRVPIYDTPLFRAW